MNLGCIALIDLFYFALYEVLLGVLLDRELTVDETNSEN